MLAAALCKSLQNADTRAPHPASCRLAATQLTRIPKTGTTMLGQRVDKSEWKDGGGLREDAGILYRIYVPISFDPPGRSRRRKGGPAGRAPPPGGCASPPAAPPSPPPAGPRLNAPDHLILENLSVRAAACWWVDSESGWELCWLHAPMNCVCAGLFWRGCRSTIPDGWELLTYGHTNPMAFWVPNSKTHCGAVQGPEDDDLIHPIQQLRPEIRLRIKSRLSAQGDAPRIPTTTTLSRPRAECWTLPGAATN